MVCMGSKAKGGWSHVGRCQSTCRVRGHTLMTPDHTTIQVRSSGYGRVGVGRFSWKRLNARRHETTLIRCLCSRLTTPHRVFEHLEHCRVTEYKKHELLTQKHLNYPFVPQTPSNTFSCYHQTKTYYQMMQYIAGTCPPSMKPYASQEIKLYVTHAHRNPG